MSSGIANQKARVTVEHLKREALAVDLASAGLTYQQIADRLEITKSAAWKLVRHALSRAVDERNADRQALLGRELHLLDRLTQSNLALALNGDQAAAGIVLRAHERRCKLLKLEAPIQVQATVTTQMDEEIEQLMQALSEADGSRA